MRQLVVLVCSLFVEKRQRKPQPDGADVQEELALHSAHNHTNRVMGKEMLRICVKQRFWRDCADAVCSRKIQAKREPVNELDTCPR